MKYSQPLISLPEVRGLLFNGRIDDLRAIVDELRGELLDLSEQTNTIQATADGEKRELTEDEEKHVDSLMARFDEVTDEIGRREKMINQAVALTDSFGTRTQKQAPEGSGDETPRRRVPAQAKEYDSGKGGFKSFGEFANTVRIACAKSSSVDPRLLQNAPTTYGSEGVGEDGGFAVPPDFRTAIMEKIVAEDSLLGRTDQLTTSSNSITFPADETAPWDATGGLQAFWSSEGSQITQSKPALKEKEVRLHKLTALVPITEELMEDAGTLDGYLRRRVPERFDHKIQNAILRGSGAGQPLGILNSGSLVSVAKDTTTSPTQPADTIRFKNIVDMWSRLYAPYRANAVWLVNQDIEPQLLQMAFDPDASSKVPVYLPANGAAGSPFATLMGRPVIPIQSASTLGDQGDIILANLSQYLTVTKVGGVRTDVSMHLFFDYDQLAYRFIMRIAGMPWWNSPITPDNGSNTLSAFVTLDERA